MAEIMLPSHSSYTENIQSMSPTVPLPGAAPRIEMLPNPDFSFPRIPPADSMPQPPPNNRAHRRPMSVHMDMLKPQANETSHRRGASMLPSFTFNAGDATGLTADQPEPTQTSPSRSAHKRNTSELIGGHGIGMMGAISASPTKTAPLAVPGRPSGHKSRASRVTLSSSDWSAVMTTAETQPRLSSSLPNTPLDGPPSSSTDSNDVFGPPLDSLPVRTPRPRVEFSEDVEYIPRPLSTISSETESSMSTVRGHSVNNSISSVLSLGSPSPPSSRARTPSLSTTLEDEPRSRTKSSIELSKRIEREGQWLKHGQSHESLHRPFSQPSAMPNKLTFATEPVTGRGRDTHAKHKSLSHALGLDRRRSEPAMGMHVDEPSRLSTLSLQDPVSHNSLEQSSQSNTEQRSSSRRLKDWAVSKMSRRGRESGRPHSEHLALLFQPQHAGASPVIEPASAETDLDAVFSMEADPLPSVGAHAQRVEMETPQVVSHLSAELPESDDSGAMLDLDAALGPFKTPPFGAQKPRRELHSSRGTRDFFGPGGHYQPTPSHRRAESAPMLTPWDQIRTGTPPQPGMADVFEEEEEEETDSARPGSTSSTQDEESRMGVQIVDSDVGMNSSTPNLSLDDGLRSRHAEWETERASTAFSTMSSSLAMPMLDRRASSIIEDTIIEESSPVEPAIVEFHEEPRAHSLTKSSDSSETPTIIGGQPGTLSLPHGQPPLTTPESFQTSAFSTPDFARRQSSFDTSRVGTSASSITDNRTVSSCTTGDPTPDVRISVDDIPSLTSSRSTMFSTSNANSSRRDISGLRTPSVASNTLDPTIHYDRRRKRASIASLSQLVGAPFGSRPATGISELRPQTAATDLSNKEPKKKEHRLKKLMFWKSKHRQASSSTIS
ncbi:hypothetical protein DOTSEDRAFT_67559 [Dothistroma septosporum NZE10]|uniref:Cell wall proline rich protein n=1 Tax=Dothistroma septosporum (strain NZE10 / CBS 128990) TaxID=675120 RepID=N1PYN8_DOTSN|nr:hypothetical protein DOTSEDRAFT_67559 [Dothistroma septosporum NZE10]